METEIEKVNSFCDLILGKIQEKIENVFESKEWKNSETYKFDIETPVKKINNLIDKHKTKTDEFDKQKQDAKKKLLKHFAAEFIKEIKPKEKQKTIKDKESKLSRLKDEIEKLNQEIAEIDRKLSNELKGAERINEYLKLYFGKGNIIIDITSDKKYCLRRNGVRATNLSEGEKTAIAFAYFITRLDDRHTELENTVIYLDDPISSLDSNHLYNTFSVIKRKLDKCKQLFISTRN